MKNFIDDALGFKGKYDYLHLPTKLDTKKNCKRRKRVVLLGRGCTAVRFKKEI